MNILSCIQFFVKSSQLEVDLIMAEGVEETTENEHPNESTGVMYKFIANLRFDKKKLIQNGLFYNLGTQNNTQQYQHPYTSCIIDAHSSTLNGSCQISSFIGLSYKVTYCITKSNEQSQVVIDLKDKHVVPTHYALRNYSNGDGYWITGWNLEGKNDSDCKAWRVIDAQKRSDDLKGKGKIAVFTIKNMKQVRYFNQLRIRITDTMNDQSSWQLALSGFEVYGCLYDAYPIPNGFGCVYTCKYDKKATQKENDENGLFYVLGTNFKKRKIYKSV